MLEIRPSSVLCDYQIGDTFYHENGKRYILLKRDAVKCTIERYTWFDEMFEKVAVKLFKLRRES